MAKVFHTGVSDEGKIRETLRQEGFFNVFKWCDRAGTRYPTHTHPHYEVRWILSGRLVIEEGGTAVELKPGDRMESEPDTPHSAYAPEEVCYICGNR